MKESEKNLIGSAFHILQHELYINSQKHGFHLREDEVYYVKDGPTGYKEVDLTAEFKAVRVALAHSELSEKLEGIRTPHQDEHCPEFSSEEIETADTLIRLFEEAEHRGLRLFEAVMAKHEYNISRPMMHGGKKF